VFSFSLFCVTSSAREPWGDLLRDSIYDAASESTFSNSYVMTSLIFVSSLMAFMSSYAAVICVSATWAVRQYGVGSRTAILYPMYLAAIAIIRPSCPPPIIPIVLGGRITLFVCKSSPHFCYFFFHSISIIY